MEPPSMPAKKPQSKSASQSSVTVPELEQSNSEPRLGFNRSVVVRYARSLMVFPCLPLQSIPTSPLSGAWPMRLRIALVEPGVGNWSPTS
jgi:hypothetical protein